MCLSHLFFSIVCLFDWLIVFSYWLIFILSSYVLSGKKKRKIPVPECQKVSLLSRFSCHQALKPFHSSCLPKSTGYRCAPETRLPLAWSLSQFLPLSAGIIRSSPLSADESTLGPLETPAHLLAPALPQQGQVNFKIKTHRKLITKKGR